MPPEQAATLQNLPALEKISQTQLPRLDSENYNQLGGTQQTIPSPLNCFSAIRHDSFSDYELDEQPINFMFESLIRKYAVRG